MNIPQGKELCIYLFIAGHDSRNPAKRYLAIETYNFTDGAREFSNPNLRESRQIQSVRTNVVDPLNGIVDVSIVYGGREKNIRLKYAPGAEDIIFKLDGIDASFQIGIDAFGQDYVRELNEKASRAFGSGVTLHRLRQETQNYENESKLKQVSEELKNLETTESVEQPVNENAEEVTEEKTEEAATTDAEEKEDE